MAERLADMGDAAVLPEMFYRDATYAPFDLKTVFGHPTNAAGCPDRNGHDARTNMAERALTSSRCGAPAP